jgi:nicotinamide mononucleotide transporter
MKLSDHFIFLSTSLLLGLLLGYLFDHFTEQQLPYLDGVISITAVGCTLLVVSKFRENWLYWMGINAASVYLYASQNLMVFTTMSILLFVVAWRGYLVWKNPSN